MKFMVHCIAKLKQKEKIGTYFIYGAYKQPAKLGHNQTKFSIANHGFQQETVQTFTF